MKKITLYHNPRCSKSRKALELLQEKDIDLVVIDYLKTPIGLKELIQLKAYIPVRELVRNTEPLFKELQLSLEEEASLLQALIKNPILLQRPIVLTDKSAFIARPPEKILDFL